MQSTAVRRLEKRAEEVRFHAEGVVSSYPDSYNGGGTVREIHRGTFADGARWGGILTAGWPCVIAIDPAVVSMLTDDLIGRQVETVYFAAWNGGLIERPEWEGEDWYEVPDCVLVLDLIYPTNDAIGREIAQAE